MDVLVMRSATPAEWCEKVSGEEDGKNSRVKVDISRRPMRRIAAVKLWEVSSSPNDA